MKKLNIGLIGAGSISKLHLDAYQKNEHATIYAICDRNEDRARRKAELYGAIKIYSSYEELLADPHIDTVDICTWNNSHAEISIAALKAGKHVHVEKPLCKTVEEALAIEEAVKVSGKVLQVGFVRRHSSNVALLKGFIDEGELGEIYYAKASILRRLGNPGGWFSDKERSGGGPLIDLGVHVIDLCWYLMGRPKVVSVSGNTYRKLGNRSNVEHLSFYKAEDFNAEHNDVEDLANALIRFENGASLFIDVSFTLHAKEDKSSVIIYGDKGGAEIEPDLTIVAEKNNVIFNLVPQVNHRGLDIEAAFQQEMNSFIGCCLNQETTISPVEDGVEIMKILCAIYESAQKGTEVRL